MMNWGALTAATALALGAAQSAPPPIPVSLNFTVTDRASHYVTDLQAGDFTVIENGVRQEVTSVVLGQRRSIVLLLDTSASMEHKLAIAQDAAIEFARRLRSQDLAEVIGFDLRVVVLQSFTNDAGALERAIRRTSARGSTSLYTAISLALTDLKTSGESTDESRRQAIVVLSDGEDTSSAVGLDRVLDSAKRSDAAIYTISLNSTDGSAARNSREGALAIRLFAQETGGRAFFPNRMSDLAGVYSQIFDELSSEYSVGYTSKNPTRDGKRRRIAVKVNQPNLTIRTRQAYFAPTRIK